jgi:hypothetical protein
MKRSLLVHGIVFTIAEPIRTSCTWALDQTAAVKLCREYLASEDRTERQRARQSDAVATFRYIC